MWLALLGLLACLLATFYLFVRQCHSHWEKHGISHEKPTFFFGNMMANALGKKSLFEVTTELYNKFPNYKYIGIYKFLNRSVMIRDPELLNEMLVKDFRHFADNEVAVDENVDYIMSKNLFTLKGHQWKTTRALLTPMFSSGKLKFVFPFSEQISRRMSGYIANEIAENRGACVNGKQLCLKFTIDNVGTCAFGLDAKAFEGETKFAQVVKDFNDNSYVNAVKFMLLFMFPKLNGMLKIKFFKDDIERYLTDVVGETLRYRRENNIERNDFLEQIVGLKEKSAEYPFTDRDVVAQGAGFFVDGVETSAGVASYVLAEIGRHPAVQQKVREELRKVKAAHGGEMTYEAMHETHYLDCVINESLRMNGPGGGLFKVCTKTYTLPEISETNKTRVVLNPGDTIFAPVDGFHMDPAYFPDPKVFNPDRFSDENKHTIAKYTYLPFGAGPRHCIGMRFAMLQVKMIVNAAISDYQLDINPKMLPYATHPMSFLKAPLNGFWFDFKKLEE